MLITFYTMVGFEQQGELWQQVLCQVSTVVSARSFWWPRATFVRAILGPCFFSSVMLDAVCNTTLVHITGTIWVFMPISWRQYEQSAFRFFTVFTMSWRSTAKQQNQIDGITTFIYTWYGLTKQMISELSIRLLQLKVFRMFVLEKKTPEWIFSPRSKEPITKESDKKTGWSSVTFS